MYTLEDFVAIVQYLGTATFVMLDRNCEKSFNDQQCVKKLKI